MYPALVRLHPFALARQGRALATVAGFVRQGPIGASQAAHWPACTLGKLELRCRAHAPPLCNLYW